MLNYEGKRLMLIEAPYLCEERAEYEAGAVDQFDGEYMVTWDCVPNYQNYSFSTQHCEWSNPKKVKRV